MMHNSANCKHCNKPLAYAIGKSQAYCADASSQRAKVNDQLIAKQAQKAKLVEQIKRRIRSDNESVYTSTSVEQENEYIGLVPANTNRESKLAVKRIAAFKAHLTNVLSGQGKPSEFPYSSPEYQYLDKNKTPKWLATACATCRGYCCRLGQDHAFLDSESIAAIKLKVMVQSSDDLVALYLGFIKKRSLESGCIFQGEQGCQLPQEMRSHTCNRYLCSEVKQIMSETSGQRKSTETIYFASVHDGQVFDIN